MFKNTLKILSVVSILALPNMVKADTFIYTDTKYDFKMSFPDTWKKQTPDTPTTRIRIAAPAGTDMATCRVKATEDKRLDIYPKYHMESAIQHTLNKKFWQNEMSEFTDFNVLNHYSPAGLGQGDATGIFFSYAMPNVKNIEVIEPKPEMMGNSDDDMDMASKTDKHYMRGLMLSTIYGGVRYTSMCSSDENKFHEWLPLFGSIVESVTFDDKYAMVHSGYYRDFLTDPKLIFLRDGIKTDYEKDLYKSSYFNMKKNNHFNR